MRKMLSLFWITQRVRFTVATNRIIHFVKGLTGKGRYGTRVKWVFTVLGVLSVFMRKLLAMVFSIAFSIFAGVLLAQASVHGQLFALFRADNPLYGFDFANVAAYTLVFWFILSVVGAPLSSVSVGEGNHKNDDLMINYLRADPAVFVKSRILVHWLGNTLLYAPFISVLLWLMGLSWWGMFLLLLVYITANIAGEALNLWLFAKTARHLGNYGLLLAGTAVILLAGILVPFYIGTPDWGWFFGLPGLSMILLPVAIVFLLRYLNRYPAYFAVISDKLCRWEAYYKKYQVTGTVTQADAAAAINKGMEASHVAADGHRNKRGFAYLNAIFFDRHRGFYHRRMRNRAIWMLLPLAAATLLALYSHLVAGEAPLYFLQGWFTPPENLDIFFSLTPFFLFIIYLASMGKVVTASVFSNCDIHMLHYPYYRTGKTILASFKARFQVILRYNFMITTGMFIAAIGTLTLLYGYFEPLNTALFFVALTFMGILFSFNDLFLYYVIQPYDTAGVNKSVPYKIIDFVIYMIAFQFMYLRLALVPFTIVVAGAVVLYLVLGLALLTRFAPRRFRLR